jgi:phospholipid/cholesterol/gamma-HCH transport system ATP-binding protein
MEAQQPIIKVEHIYSGYQDRDILSNISLEVFPNEVLVILGVSGCGKTTLLKHLIGLMRPKRGNIEILGQNLIAADEHEQRNILKQIGVLFQNGALLNSLPLSENLAIPLQQHTSLSDEIITQLVKVKLGLVGLEYAYDYFPAQLSGGMRKRAALARALALDPVILFADEPGAGLDPVTAASLDHLLLTLKEQLGMTLVVVTHEVGSIRRIASRILYLHEGEVLFSGSLADALATDIPQLANFFKS